uniref:C1q domain-containing protein n=1 Tax=Biomphalaria glabrata TaxID=6526 RepID=A0A2C9LQS5_BIOGL
MRPVRQLKIITSQLELLEDLRIQLDSLLVYINNVLKTGESWIEKKDDTQTFLEVNMLLANETSNCIQKCLDIARENQELFQTSSSTEQKWLVSRPEQSISSDDSMLQSSIVHNDEIEKSISSIKSISKSNEENCATLLRYYDTLNNLTNAQSEKMQIMDQQLKEQTKQFEAMRRQQDETEKSYRQKLDEVRSDLIAVRAAQSSKISYTQSGASSKAKDTAKRGNILEDLDDVEFDDLFPPETPTSEKKNDCDVGVFEGRLALLERNRSPVAFDVSVDELIERNIKQGEILKCFNSVLFNKGNNYNLTTGIFTAPFSGLYMCSLFIDINQLQDLQFCVCRKAANGSESVVVTTHANKKNSTFCDIGLVDLKPSDKLYVKAMSDCVRIQFNFYSHFMCILLNKY